MQLPRARYPVMGTRPAARARGTRSVEAGVPNRNQIGSLAEGSDRRIEWKLHREQRMSTELSKNAGDSESVAPIEIRFAHRLPGEASTALSVPVAGRKVLTVVYAIPVAAAFVTKIFVGAHPSGYAKMAMFGLLGLEGAILVARRLAGARGLERMAVNFALRRSHRTRYVTAEGIAVADAPPFLSELSGREAVLTRTIKKAAGQIPSTDTTVGVPFSIRTDTGKTYEIDLSDDLFFDEPPPAPFDATVASPHTAHCQNDDSEGPPTAWESRVGPGDRICVLGIVVEVPSPDGEREGPRSPPMVSMLTGSASSPLVIRFAHVRKTKRAIKPIDEAT